MREKKHLGWWWWWETVAGWLLLWLCSLGRSSALGEWSLAEQRPLFHRHCCTSWMHQLCLRVLTGRKALHLLHLCMGCFSSGVQRSCIPSPEEGVCWYHLQLQTVSSPALKQALISCPFLGCSSCWLSLLFHKHPPALGFSLPCIYIFLFMHLSPNRSKTKVNCSRHTFRRDIISLLSPQHPSFPALLSNWAADCCYYKGLSIE